MIVRFDPNYSTILNKLIDTTAIEGAAIKSLGWVMVAAGVITLLIATFGCMGALWKNRCFLYMYAVVLGILIIVELAGFILALTYRGKLEKIYDEDLAKIFISGYVTNNTEIKGAIQTLEKQFKCCGITDQASLDYTRNEFPIPAECYDDKGKLYTIGCADAIIKFLKDNLPIFASVMGSFLLIEIFGIVAAISLGVAISHSQTDRYSS